jgi:hypothetical protein
LIGRSGRVALGRKLAALPIISDNPRLLLTGRSFQEEFFSPRRLIFVNGQVIFCCGTDWAFREDIVSEYQVFGMEDYVYKLPKPAFSGTAMLRFLGKGSSNLLGGVITKYSSRELSYQSDILNAFAGVLDMMKNDLGAEMCFGLLSSALTHEMSWRLSGKSALRRLGFPSWSWCGWLGEAVTPTCASLEKWTTQCSWVEWYIYDGNGQFRLLPQNKWQEHVRDEPDVTLASLISTFKKNARQDKRTRDLDSLYEYLDKADSSQPLSNVAPLYVPLLSRHDFDENTTSPTMLAIRELKISPDTPLTSHTLYLRTLSTTVSVSVYAPDGNRSPSLCDYVHLYDTSDKYLGAAQVTDASWFTESFDISRNEKGDVTSFIPPSASKRPIHIAMLSGPSNVDSEARRNIWGSEQLTWLFAEEGNAKTNPRFYKVILLARPRMLPGSRPVAEVYERVGVGQIHSRIVERMDGLEWEDILLQ